MLVKAENTSEPAVDTAVVIVPDHNVLRDRGLAFFLCYSEIIERQEILIEGHVVVDILQRSDRSDIETVAHIAGRKAVGNGEASVEAGVVVFYPSSLFIFIWIPPLTQVARGESVAQAPFGRHPPVQLRTK